MDNSLENKKRFTAEDTEITEKIKAKDEKNISRCTDESRQPKNYSRVNPPWHRQARCVTIGLNMVTVVQWLARLTVDQKVEGSNPSSHPNKTALKALFFVYSPISVESPRLDEYGRLAAPATPAARRRFRYAAPARGAWGYAARCVVLTLIFSCAPMRIRSSRVSVSCSLGRLTPNTSQMLISPVSCTGVCGGRVAGGWAGAISLGARPRFRAGVWVWSAFRRTAALRRTKAGQPVCRAVG